MKTRVADYIADFFVENNITDVFTITGGGAMHLNDAFGHHPKLRCIYNHNEQACAIAAEGYARYCQKIAAVCVTSGPGGTNAITGVMGGWLDSIPMLIVSGQVKFTTTIKSTTLSLRQLGDQEFNIVDTVKTMTKYSVMIDNPNDIAYVLEKALFLAYNGRPGPVWIDIPLNIQSAIIDTDLLRHYNVLENINENPPELDLGLIDKIIEKINSAKRPVIFAGTGIRSSGSYDIFQTLVKKLRIPVVTAWNAHDILPDINECYAGRPGTVGNRGGNFVTQFADLLIVLGSRLNIRQISYNWKNFAKNAYIIMVDIDLKELLKPTLKVDLPIYANVKNVIIKLIESTREIKDFSCWKDWAHSINKKYPVCLPEMRNENNPLNPYVFVDSLFNSLCDDDTVVCSNGSACVIGFQGAIIKKETRLFTNSGCAAMGYGLPAALGVAIKRGAKRTICIEGDGSLQMNIQELQTVFYNKLNIKLFVINNNGYHSIRQTQTNLFNEPLVGVCDGNGLSFPELERLAYAYKLPFIRIDSYKTHNQDILTALNHEGPVIVEVVVDTNQFFSPKLSSKQLPDGTMVSPSLEDMYPFLPEDEILSIKNEAMRL